MFKVENLTYCYKLANNSGSMVLNNLNFSLPDNGLIFITGKSGSGKTTLLNILEGILRPTSGAVYFNGIDIYKTKKFDFSLHSGILFQNYNLIDNLTVFDNLKIAADLKNVNYKEIDKLLERYNLLDLKNSNIDILSGGERQRIAFLRSIINNPEVLFCDEPTGAIDEENANLLMNDLRVLAEKSLVIIVTHNKDLINDNNIVIEINSGKISSNIDLKEQKPSKNSVFLSKSKHKNNYLKILSKRLFKKSRFKHALFMLSMFFSIFSITLTLGLTFGLKKSKGKLEFSYFDHNKFSISEREKKIETDSPISLIKEIRPEKSLVKSNLDIFENYLIYNNYDYFLHGNNVVFSGSQELKNINIVLSLNAHNVVVNNLFYELLEDKSAKCSVELNQNYTYKTYKENEINKIYEERFYYSYFFEIKEVVNEFKYLNLPTIYLPLNEFELYLKQTNLDEYFNQTREIVSWYDAISFAKQDDLITSFKYDFYLENEKDIKSCYKLIDSLEENDAIKITNEAHFYSNSFLDITSILNLGLNIFCVLSIIVTFCLLFFIIISLYLQEKKEIAVLKVLGAKNSEVKSIFNNIMIFETLISYFLAIGISIICIKYLNKILEQNLGIIDLILMPNIVANKCLSLLVFLILFLCILCVIFINFLAILKASKSNSALELREE